MKDDFHRDRTPFQAPMQLYLHNSQLQSTPVHNNNWLELEKMIKFTSCVSFHAHVKLITQKQDNYSTIVQITVTQFTNILANCESKKGICGRFWAIFMSF